MTVILDNLAEELGRDDILQSYPTLEPTHIDAALAYAAELIRPRVVAPPSCSCGVTWHHSSSGS